MNKIYRQASYLTSAHTLPQLPDDIGMEVAFAGRSNAGKSTAINALTDQRSLARTSKTPGRTQQIVVFELPNGWRLMDLPGYGYAKVPEKMRRHWVHTLDLYLRKRRSLVGLILHADARHSLRPFDEQMIAWSAASGLPCHLLLTKADKLKSGAAASRLRDVQHQHQSSLLSVQLFSGLKRNGVDQVHDVLDRWFADAQN